MEGGIELRETHPLSHHPVHGHENLGTFTIVSRVGRPAVGRAVLPQPNPHPRTCWRLGGLPEYAPLRLRAWAYTLGYRGHILTKSRAYSTTYAALRADRAVHRNDGAEPGEGTVEEANWRYAGSGHTPGAAQFAAGIAEDLSRNRKFAREAMNEQGRCE